MLFFLPSALAIVLAVSTLAVLKGLAQIPTRGASR